MDLSSARIHPRVPIDITVTEMEGDNSCSVRARDISSNGIYVGALEGICLDTSPTISVEFTLPGEEDSIWALCDIVRDDRIGSTDGHALHFRQLTQLDREKIASYVQRYYSPIAVRSTWFAPLSRPKQSYMFRAASELLC